MESCITTGPLPSIVSHLEDVGTKGKRRWYNPHWNLGDRCHIPKSRETVPCPRSHSKCETEPCYPCPPPPRLSIPADVQPRTQARWVGPAIHWGTPQNKTGELGGGGGWLCQDQGQGPRVGVEQGGFPKGGSGRRPVLEGKGPRKGFLWRLLPWKPGKNKKLITTGLGQPRG